MASDMIDDPELLARIQEVLVEMPEDMDKACCELNTPYPVYGGTMTGAICRKGFIPWDDNIDVLMTRRDYKCFPVEAPVFMGPKYRLDNTRTLPEYPYMFTKFGFTGMLFILEFVKNANYRVPICLDVFPLGMVPIDPSGFKRQSRMTWLWGRLPYLTGIPTLMLVDTHGMKRLAIHTTTSIAYYGMRLLRVIPRRFQKLFDVAARRHEGKGTGRHTDFSMRDPENWAVNLSKIQPMVDVPSNGITVRIALAYDAMIRRTYGEYMELPPMEQRRNHEPVEIGFDPPGGLLWGPTMTGSEQRAPSSGRNYFWNTTRSFMMAGATVIVLIIVTRAAEVAATGAFSIALTISQ